MNPVPLSVLRLRPQHHRSALWWLALLYRQPHALRAELERLARGQQLAGAARLYLHALPYVLVIGILGRFLVYGLFGFSLERPAAELGAWPLLIEHGVNLASGIAVGVSVGIAVAITLGITDGIALGITAGIAIGIATGIAVGSAFGTAGTMLYETHRRGAFWILVSILCMAAIRLGLQVPWGVAIAVTVAAPVPIAFGVAVEAALEIYYMERVARDIAIVAGLPMGLFLSAYIYHVFFFSPAPRGRWYRFHPVGWTNDWPIAFPRLCRLLVAYAAIDKQRAEAEIERLLDHCPSQHREALKARSILIAQATRDAPILSRLDLAVASLPEGEKGFLRDVPRLKGMIADIARLQQHLDTVQIPAFRAPHAADLVREIQDFRARVAGLRYPLNTAFRAAALAWLAVAERQHTEAKRVLEARPVAQVFRAGEAVELSHEAFLPRWPVIEELHSQITLATGCPGLLLYGRRRMGKSTLLKNLPPFLPGSIAVASLSMKDPNVFSSLEKCVGSVAACTAQSGNMAAPVCGDLGGLFIWLAKLDAALASDGRRVLLALDEYENLDRKLGEGVFPRDLLDTIRESIQRYRRITWLFVGSHALAELKHPDWSSWFVSLRTVEILPFSEAETRLLLTEPMRHSRLWQDDEASRPRFDGAFWGEGGIERIHHEAAGWPHLVQLLAEQAVYRVNLRGLRACTPQVLDEAIASAIVSGDNVLYRLVYSESRLAGELDYLNRFRVQDVQDPPTDEAVYQSLRRRLMVTEKNGRWRMRVPLMQRWLRERA